MLTRTSRGLCTVRTGYVYQPPACRTYGRYVRRREAGAPLYVRRARTSLGRAEHTAYRGTPGVRCSEPTREEPAPSEAQRVICALALGTVEPAPRPGKRVALAPPRSWIGV